MNQLKAAISLRQIHGKPLSINAKDNGKMHFLGLLSDGNVHSHINHLKALIKRAKEDGVKEVRLHVLLDGRDVPETSALIYVEDIENFMAELNDEQLPCMHCQRRRTYEDHKEPL